MKTNFLVGLHCTQSVGVCIAKYLNGMVKIQILPNPLLYKTPPQLLGHLYIVKSGRSRYQQLLNNLSFSYWHNHDLCIVVIMPKCFQVRDTKSMETKNLLPEKWLSHSQDDVCEYWHNSMLSRFQKCHTKLTSTNLKEILPMEIALGVLLSV